MWNTFIYDPLYNLFVFILSFTPGKEVGVAVILFTLVVKFALFPLYKKTIISQKKIAKIQPEIKKLQEELKSDQRELGMKTMELYKKNNISPFGSIFLLLIQIPILIALYLVFSKGLADHTGNLYSFVTFPEQIDNIFFVVTLTVANVVFAVVAGITQMIQAKISLSHTQMPTAITSKEPSFQEEFQKSMRIQVLYILPLVIVFMGTKFPAAITLYWITANLFGIAQDLYVRKTVVV
jgi:YidC/Oxa1 family membrane protein insertase